MSWYDLDLIFYLEIVTLTFLILPRLYLGNCKGYTVQCLILCRFIDLGL